jgi:hypothetical protein
MSLHAVGGEAPVLGAISVLIEVVTLSRLPVRPCSRDAHPGAAGAPRRGPDATTCGATASEP